jgi:FMN-dependent NADH-azoreductase
MNILHIDCSPRPESHSRQLSAAIVEKLLEVSPGASISRRDFAAVPPPHASPDYAPALSSPATLAAPAEGRAGAFRSTYSGSRGGRCDCHRNAHEQLNRSVGPQGVDRPNPSRRSHVHVDAGREDGNASGSSSVCRHHFRWRLYRRPSNQPEFLTPYASVVLGSIGLKTLQFLSVQATAFLDRDQATLAREKAHAAIDLTVMGEVPCL